MENTDIRQYVNTDENWLINYIMCAKLKHIDQNKYVQCFRRNSGQLHGFCKKRPRSTSIEVHTGR